MTGYESKKAMARDKLTQEPVAWAVYDKRGGSRSLHWHEQHSPDGNANMFDAVPLYTTSPSAQPAQEPFGYLSIGGNPIFQKEKPEIGRWETLYTTPPQRTWVGLTDEQIADYLDEYHAMTESELRFFRLGEAAAKEQNNG